MSGMRVSEAHGPQSIYSVFVDGATAGGVLPEIEPNGRPQTSTGVGAEVPATAWLRHLARGRGGHALYDGARKASILERPGVAVECRWRCHECRSAARVV